MPDMDLKKFRRCVGGEGGGGGCCLLGVAIICGTPPPSCGLKWHTHLLRQYGCCLACRSLLASVLFVCNVGCAFIGLRVVDVPMFLCVRRVTTVCVLVTEYFMLKKVRSCCCVCAYLCGWICMCMRGCVCVLVHVSVAGWVVEGVRAGWLGVCGRVCACLLAWVPPRCPQRPSLLHLAQHLLHNVRDSERLVPSNPRCAHLLLGADATASGCLLLVVRG